MPARTATDPPGAAARVWRTVTGPPQRTGWLWEIEFHGYLAVAGIVVLYAITLAPPEGKAPPSGVGGWVVALLPSLVVLVLAAARWWRPRYAGELAALGVGVCVAVAFARYAVPPWRSLYLATLLGPAPVLLTSAVRRARAPVATAAALAGVVLVLAWATLRLNLPGIDRSQIDRGALVPLGDIALTLLLVLIPLTAGVLLRIADARRHAAELARLRAEERRQVARELHDLVANHVTGMTMYAQGAGALPDVPARVHDALGVIEASGSDALTAMHRMVEVLRRDADPGPGALDALPTTATDLPGAVRSALDESDGVRVRIDPPLTSATATPVLLGTVHRVVAEAMTNVRRHAPQARDVGVRLWSPQDGTITVEVSNDRPGRSPRRDGGGFGLVGLRERVGALGGRCTPVRTATAGGTCGPNCHGTPRADPDPATVPAWGCGCCSPTTSRWCAAARA